MNHNAIASIRNGVLIAVLIAGPLTIAACSNSPDQQVWTTKNQSMLGVQTDSPSLNAESAQGGSHSNARSLKEPAISVLLQAAESNDALLRANAIEALHHAPEYLPPVLQRALVDANRGVRYVAAISVGKFTLLELVALTEPLLHDESKSVQAAAMYALRRCGQKVDLNPLAAMLQSEDPEVKGNAAYVLGELDDRTAVELLRQSVGVGLNLATASRRRIVELQVAEAMVKLGATKEIDVIRAALFATSEEAEVAALACQLCGELKDGGALADLANIVHRSGPMERPPEIRMAAAQAVAEIDPTTAPARSAPA
jgi:HEAT repeat protein